MVEKYFLRKSNLRKPGLRKLRYYRIRELEHKRRDWRGLDGSTVKNRNGFEGIGEDLGVAEDWSEINFRKKITF